MDRIAKALSHYSWPFASQDPVAVNAISRRVAAVGRQRDLITYSNLVAGLDFQIPTVNEGRSFRLGVPEWTELHRAIIGDFCGHLCLETYVSGGFMGSALVVSQETNQPSEGYWALMHDIGVLSGKSEAERLAHWVEQTNKAYDWYSKH